MPADTETNALAASTSPLQASLNDVARDDAPSRARQKEKARPGHPERIRVYPKSVSGRFRQIKWTVLITLLGLYYVLPWVRWNRGPGCAGPGCSRRYGQSAALLLLDRNLAAGDLFSHGPADPRGLRPVPCHEPFRPGVVRLRLPADRLDRSFHVGRAADRRRPRRPHPPRQTAANSIEAGKEDGQARRLAPDRARNRRRVGHVLQRRPHGGWRLLHGRGQLHGVFLRRPADRHDLSAGRLGTRTGLYLHVPLAADPRRPARQGQPSWSPIGPGVANRAGR